MAIRDDPGVFTRERLLTIVLAILTFLAVYVCYKIVEPFVSPIAFALALAVATQSPYCWLRRKVAKPTLAAALAVILVAILIIVPAALLITYVVQIGMDRVAEFQQGGPGLRQMLEQQPVIGPIIRDLSARFRIDEQLGNIGRAIGARASGFLSGSVDIITQLAITLFVLFFLYRDSNEGMEAVRKLMPLSNSEADRLFERVASTISATVNGSLTVAFVQALLAGTVYTFLGVPGGALWGAVTFIAALIPVFGTFLVWAPIAAYVALTGSVGKAIFLAAWGALVVGSVDNVLYPYLVGDKLCLHTVPTFFSIIGGISLFGASGLILGPMALAIAIALADVWWHRTEHGQPAEQAISETALEDADVGEVLQKNEPHE